MYVLGHSLCRECSDARPKKKVLYRVNLISSHTRALASADLFQAAWRRRRRRRRRN
jgi:hypothetical protein